MGIYPGTYPGQPCFFVILAYAKKCFVPLEINEEMIIDKKGCDIAYNAYADKNMHTQIIK